MAIMGSVDRPTPPPRRMLLDGDALACIQSPALVPANIAWPARAWHINEMRAWIARAPLFISASRGAGGAIDLVNEQSLLVAKNNASTIILGVGCSAVSKTTLFDLKPSISRPCSTTA
eukprot:6194689-Pleurochrysis_carterae.AAC.2